MKKPIRYTDDRGGLVIDIKDRALLAAQTITRAVRARAHKQETPEDIVERELVPILTAAFLAGDREGSTRTEGELSATVGRLVERAIKGVVLEAARCPHCLTGCDECNQTGARQS